MKPKFLVEDTLLDVFYKYDLWNGHALVGSLFARDVLQRKK